MKTSVLAIDLLRLDGDTQSRIAIDEYTVEKYAERIDGSNGEWPLGIVEVFHDGSDYWVADGFHRTLAAQRCKRGSITCHVHKGTARDAKLFAMTANDKHGLPMSRADKRACVEWLLEHGDKMTQKAIAETAGVSERTVRGIVAEHKNRQFAGSSEQPGGNRKGKPPKTGKNSTPESVGESKGEPKQYNDSFDPKQLESDDSGSAKPSGKCPSCKAKKWAADGDSWKCGKCGHFYGEPVGDVDDDALKMQKSKTVKTLEAAVRAFDDLQGMSTSRKHSEAVESCKALIEIAKGWT